MDIEGLQKVQIVRLEKDVSAQFHFACNDLKDSSFRSISSNVPLVSDPAYDMDIGSFLQLLEIQDPLSFPSNDSVPGGFDDGSTVLGFEAVVCRDTEIGNFGVSEVFDINAPDDAPEFNSV